MSGIVGIFYLDGRPVEQTELHNMTAAMAFRGVDGVTHWREGEIGLSHCRMHSTPQSLYESQPLHDRSGRYVLVFHGRVDNREELQKILASKGVLPRNDTDAEIVLSTWLVWQEECAEHLTGVFSFVIWDKYEKRLFCGRDKMGLRTLFYHHAPGRHFIWATELKPIVKHIGFNQTRPNETTIAALLLQRYPHPEATIFEGVKQLPAGKTVTISPDTPPHLHTYWQPGPLPIIKYKTDAQYAEHFRALFDEAVRCRMRSHTDVAIQLSGGVDSSSVAGAAASLVQLGEINTALQSASLVFADQPSIDETAYINATIKKWPIITSHLLPETENYIDTRPTHVEDSYALPGNLPGNYTYSPLYDWLESSNCRVILTGHGSDEWFWRGDYHHIADAIKAYQPMTVLRYLAAEKKRNLSIRNNPLLKSLRHLLPLQTTYPTHIYNHLNADWLSSTNVLRDSYTQNYRHEHLTLLQSWHWNVGGAMAGYSNMDRLYTRHSTEARHPFMDMRLVEFCLSLPIEQLQRSGKTKYVLRNALSPYLADMIRTRPDKAIFNEKYTDLIKNLGGERLFYDLKIMQNGWLDQPSLYASYPQMLTPYSEYLMPFLKILTVEQWYVNMRFEGRSIKKVSYQNT